MWKTRLMNLNKGFVLGIILWFLYNVFVTYVLRFRLLLHHYRFHDGHVTCTSLLLSLIKTLFHTLSLHIFVYC